MRMVVNPSLRMAAATAAMPSALVRRFCAGTRRPLLWRSTMVQRIPSKPDYLSQADFDYIVARDKRQCVYYGDCPHAKNGSACCDEAVDFDHEQPVELGGDDTPGNVRLLCS